MPLCMAVIFLQFFWFWSLESFLIFSKLLSKLKMLIGYITIFFSCRSFLLMTALVDDIHFNQFASVLLKDSVRSLINHL